MYRFLGVRHLDFVPEGKKDPVQGYKFFFSESYDTMQNVVGEVPFSSFLTIEAGKRIFSKYNEKNPTMGSMVEFVGYPVDLSFNRQGKVVDIRIIEE